MLRNDQAGFTLVEIVVSLAIAALLLPIVFNGQRQVRARAQFSDSVERVTQTIRDVKNEGNTTVNSNTGGSPGTDIYKLVYGKALTFTPGSANIIVDTLLCSPLDSLSQCSAAASSPMVTIDATSEYTVTIPWGTTYEGPLTQILIFTKGNTNGALVAYAPRVWNLSGLPYTRLSFYNPASLCGGNGPCTRPGGPIQTDGRDLLFKNIRDNLTADVYFDAQSMSVSRVIH